MEGKEGKEKREGKREKREKSYLLFEFGFQIGFSCL